MRKTTSGESSLVTTEEAKAITADRRVCRDVSWDISRSSNGDHTKQTFNCYSAPEDEYGMTTEGLYFDGVHTFGLRTKHEKLTLTLWKMTKKRDPETGLFNLTLGVR